MRARRLMLQHPARKQHNGAKQMENMILIGIIVAVVAMASVYIWRSKKKGVKCIGCPMGGKCSGHCGGTDMPHR